MSIYRTNRDNFEFFTLKASPKRTFSSSSSGVTGSVSVFARRSEFEKEVKPLDSFNDSKFNDANIEGMLRSIQQTAGTTNIQNKMSNYLTEVNRQGVSARKNKSIEITRFEPSVTYTTNTTKKNIIRNILYPYYRSRGSNYNWSYTNYHSMNFMTASSFSPSAALLFPNSSSLASTSAASGSYVLPKAFTFDFYIKPNQTNKNTIGFKAGTILHLSSSYAISLVSGSRVDEDGNVSGYRLKLQLSHSADFPPSHAAKGNYPKDLIFMSDDNSLAKDKWHHVAIRWGTSEIAAGSGSFFIDGAQKGIFVIPSSTLAPAPFTLSGNPDVLTVGNYFEGINRGTSAQALFFASRSATRDGLVNLVPADTARTEPATFSMRHPLSAEIHDLKIFGQYRTDNQILTQSQTAPTTLDGLKFYLPPFFQKKSPRRVVVDSAGGVLQTPFFAISATTDDPFNVALSFGIGGHYLNLENFTQDIASKLYPRHYHLTASEITFNAAQALSANEYLYSTGSNRYRNIFMLPCDNGRFVPNFDFVASGSTARDIKSGSVDDKYTNDLGVFDPTLISLTELVPSSTLFDGLLRESGSIVDEVMGPSPENPGVNPKEVLTIFQRTRDSSSNEVVFFNISNLFYGKRIEPGTFEITDSSVTGSKGHLSIKIRDDGYGSLYRADSKTEHAKWNSIGNIFYDEGIVVIKTPNIPLFGKDQFEVSFNAEQNLHTLKMSIPARAGLFNSSSNPAFKIVSASLDANDKDPEFVYITGINYHDENLNVVMKTNLAQPVIKRNSDKYLFRTKIDF